MSEGTKAAAADRELLWFDRTGWVERLLGWWIKRENEEAEFLPAMRRKSSYAKTVTFLISLTSLSFFFAI
jgi:hypothetical protein